MRMEDTQFIIAGIDCDKTVVEFLLQDMQGLSVAGKIISNVLSAGRCHLEVELLPAARCHFV